MAGKKGVEIASAYISLNPSLLGFAKKIEEELGVKLAEVIARTGEKSGKSFGQKFAEGLKSDALKSFGSSLTKIGAIPALLSITQGITSMGVAAAPAAGALLAIPGAALLAKAGMSALTVATTGFGDAITAVMAGDAKKLEKLMKDLSPAAREVVREFQRAKPVIDAIKNATQDAFFQPLIGTTTKLAKTFGGPFKRGMSETSGEMGRLVKSVADVASTGDGVKLVDTTFGVLSKTIKAIEPGVKAVTSGVIKFLTVSVGSFDGVGDSINRALLRFGAFLDRIAESGRALEIINKGKATLAQLGRIAGNVGKFMGGVFAAKPSGDGVLTQVETITARMAAWSTSAKGSDQLTRMFETIGRFAQAGGDVLTTLGPIIAAIVSAFNSLPGPVKDAAIQFAAWGLVIGPIVGKVGALVGAGQKAVGFFGAVRKSATDSGGTLNKVGTVLSGAGKKINDFGKLIGTGISTATVAVGKFAGNMAVAAGKAVAGFARMAASAVVTAARVVAGWVLMGAHALAQAARMAAAWLIALGPIGVLIAAVIAIVAIIIIYWDEIAAATTIAWAAVSNAVSSAWQSIVAGIQLALNWAWGLIQAGWALITDIFLNWTVPGLVIQHWDTIVSVFTVAWQTLRNGVSDALGWISREWQSWQEKISYHVGRARDALGGLWDGLKNNARAAMNIGIGYANKLIDALNVGIRGLNRIPGMNIAAVGHMPMLAKGGITTGPTIATIGEAGQEAVIPLDRLDEFVGSRSTTVVIDGSGLDRAMAEWLRRSVRVVGAGSVQSAFGRY